MTIALDRTDYQNQMPAQSGYAPQNYAPQQYTQPGYAPAPQQSQSYLAPNGINVLDTLRGYAESWRYAAEIGSQLSNTKFSGVFRGDPEGMTVAVLMGASLGIPPQLVAKSIYVVHGVPTLSGKTAISLALSAGYTFERLEFSAERVTVKCITPQGKEHQTTYTIQRAENEGLVKGNRLQYTNRPAKMLFWKCIGELADQVFPHIVNGMGVAQDYVQSDDEFRSKESESADELIAENIDALPLPAEPADNNGQPAQPVQPAEPAQDLVQQAQQRTQNAMSVLDDVLGAKPVEAQPAPAQPAPAQPAPAQPAPAQPETKLDPVINDMDSLVAAIHTASDMGTLNDLYVAYSPQLGEQDLATMVEHLNARQAQIEPNMANRQGDA